MASNRFNQTLNIKIKSSLAKCLLIIVPHLLAAIALMIFLDLKEINIFYLITLLLCISISLVYFIKLHLLLKFSKSIHEIQKSTNGVVKLQLGNGLIEDVSILASSFVSNLLIIINFRDKYNKYYTALITSDSISADEFRRLKVYLKTNKQEV